MRKLSDGRLLYAIDHFRNEVNGGLCGPYSLDALDEHIDELFGIRIGKGALHPRVRKLIEQGFLLGIIWKKGIFSPSLCLSVEGCKRREDESDTTSNS